MIFPTLSLLVVFMPFSCYCCNCVVYIVRRLLNLLRELPVSVAFTVLCLGWLTCTQGLCELNRNNTQ